MIVKAYLINIQCVSGEPNANKNGKLFSDAVDADGLALFLPLNSTFCRV